MCITVDIDCRVIEGIDDLREIVEPVMRDDTPPGGGDDDMCLCWVDHERTAARLGRRVEIGIPGIELRYVRE